MLHPVERILSATSPTQEDHLATWLGDPEAAEACRHVGTVRSVLAYALRVFPDRRDLWRHTANLEKAHGTRESEQIWLAAVKLKAENGELGVAHELLVRAWTVADTEQ